MTIDSSWAIALKQEAPDAFTEKACFTPDAVFVDLQIRLMQPVLDTTETWDEYLFRVYESYIKRCFNQASTVIVAFDDYSHVPLAKAPTQQKRRRNIPQISFTDRDSLPPVVPRRDQWSQCMANRTFKNRLIHLITHTLGKRALHGLTPNQTLVIDWTSPPLLFRGGATEPEPLTSLAALGESDVKFTRYGDMYPNLQVDSVDGDCIPIALLKMESGFQGNFSIYHLQTRVDPPNKKRTASGEPVASAQSKPKRVYEHVNVRILYKTILRRVIPRGGAPPGHGISMLVSLIGLSGTDFTRSLPLVSGKTLYEMIPDIWEALSEVYDPKRRALDPERVADTLIARIYHLKFAKHTFGGGFADVTQQIAGSKLGDKTKQSLPSERSIHCTARNINWLIAYWVAGTYPDPLQPMYGFTRGKTGQIGHDD